MSIECNDNNNKNGNIIFVGNLLKFQSKKYNKENLKWIKSDIYWYFIDWYIFYFILEKNSNDKNNVLILIIMLITLIIIQKLVHAI